MSRFSWVTAVDGTPVDRLTLEGAKIEYGRGSVFEQPSPPYAVLTLMTPDYWPLMPADLVEFGLGSSGMPSGFVDLYDDDYAGPLSRVTIGATVTVNARTESGFTDAYEDHYGGLDLRRFTGHVVAIEYQWDSIQLTCLPDTEAWARISVGGTDDVTTIPAETDADRAARLATEASVTLDIDGTDGPQVIAIQPSTAARPLTEMLDALASETGGLFYTDRDGLVHYRTKNFLPTTNRINYIPNPSFSVNTTGWFAENSILTRVTSDFDTAPAAMDVTVHRGPQPAAFSHIDGSIAEGDVFTGSAYVKDVDTGITSVLAIINWYDGTTYLSQTSETTTGIDSLHWERVTVTGTAPTGADTAYFMVKLNGSPVTGSYLIDSAQAERSSVATPFFDGSMDGCRWSGTADASTTYGPELFPSYATIRDSLAMSLELGLVMNNITVTYGDSDPLATVTATDATSITAYGQRDANYTTQIDLEADAQDYADWLLASLDAAWQLPDLTMALAIATDTDIAKLASIEQGTPVIVPQLLPGSPQTSYVSQVLGYTETISRTNWQITYHLAPSQAPIPGAAA